MESVLKRLHLTSTNDQKTTKFLLQIVKDLSSDNAWTDGIYRLIKLFTGVENAKNDEKYFTIPAEKLDKKEKDEKWICAEKQPKNLLKPILEELFELELKLKSNNFTLLMILSVTIRICAIFGSEKDQYSLEAFLTAYKCANVGENQQRMMYSYKTIACPKLTISHIKMLPIYKDKNNELSLNLSNEIAEINIYKTNSASAEQNFNFLLNLSAVDLTPFSIVFLARQIHRIMNAFIMKEEKFRFDFDNVQLSKLAIAHFTGKSIAYYKKYDEKSFWTSLDAICIIHLSNFMVNLLNGILNSPKLNTYFVHTGLSKELEEEQQFFSHRLNQYSQKLDEKLQNENVEREHYLHFEDAIRINWNPYKKEMFKLIQVLKYQCFCSTELYSLGFNKGFEKELHKECDEMYKILVSEGKDLLFGVEIIASDEKNELLKPLQPLENIEQIKKAYEKLKTFLKEKRNGKCNEKEEKENGYNAIVKLNKEFGKAFEKVLKEF
ncbi:hypothetical protein GPALN_004459 [Globodera pallida]|nr:hypothetical protein GPALN_004459 [Globodera pallida]